jgi:signal transduction histidine kinase
MRANAGCDSVPATVLLLTNQAMNSSDERLVQREVYDTAQRRLVNSVIALKLAKEALAGAGGPAADLVDEALQSVESATAELRGLGHGIAMRATRRASGRDE